MFYITSKEKETDTTLFKTGKNYNITLIVIMSEGAKIFLFLLIVVSNLLFLFYWVFLIYKDLKEKLILKH